MYISIPDLYIIEILLAVVFSLASMIPVYAEPNQLFISIIPGVIRATVFPIVAGLLWFMLAIQTASLNSFNNLFGTSYSMPAGYPFNYTETGYTATGLRTTVANATVLKINYINVSSSLTHTISFISTPLSLIFYLLGIIMILLAFFIGLSMMIQQISLVSRRQNAG